jgi:hypothetical protein
MDSENVRELGLAKEVVWCPKFEIKPVRICLLAPKGTPRIEPNRKKMTLCSAVLGYRARHRIY